MIGAGFLYLAQLVLYSTRVKSQAGATANPLMAYMSFQVTLHLARPSRLHSALVTIYQADPGVCIDILARYYKEEECLTFMVHAYYPRALELASCVSWVGPDNVSPSILLIQCQYTLDILACWVFS